MYFETGVYLIRAQEALVLVMGIIYYMYDSITDCGVLLVIRDAIVPLSK